MRTCDAVIVTGFAEARDVLLDSEHFSSVISTGGPTVPLPFKPEGDDITAQIDAHHAAFVGSELFITYDGMRHAASRSLLNSPDAHVILPDVISKEPLSPVVRQGDPAWTDLVRWTLNALVLAEELNISGANAEAMRKESTNPEVRRLLGSEREERRGLSDERDPMSVTLRRPDDELGVRAAPGGSMTATPSSTNAMYT